MNRYCESSKVLFESGVSERLSHFPLCKVVAIAPPREWPKITVFCKLNADRNLIAEGLARYESVLIRYEKNNVSRRYSIKSTQEGDGDE